MSMADATAGDDFGVPVHIIAKSDREQVRISLNEYRGFDYIDLRVFYLADTGYRPSKRGFTIKRELFPELFRGVVELGQALGFDEGTLLRALDE